MIVLSLALAPLYKGASMNYSMLHGTSALFYRFYRSIIYGVTSLLLVVLYASYSLPAKWDNNIPFEDSGPLDLHDFTFISSSIC